MSRSFYISNDVFNLLLSFSMPEVDMISPAKFFEHSKSIEIKGGLSIPIRINAVRWLTEHIA